MVARAFVTQACQLFRGFCHARLPETTQNISQCAEQQPCRLVRHPDTSIDSHPTARKSHARRTLSKALSSKPKPLRGLSSGVLYHRNHSRMPETYPGKCFSTSAMSFRSLANGSSTSMAITWRQTYSASSASGAGNGDGKG